MNKVIIILVAVFISLPSLAATYLDGSNKYLQKNHSISVDWPERSNKCEHIGSVRTSRQYKDFLSKLNTNDKHVIVPQTLYPYQEVVIKYEPKLGNSGDINKIRIVHVDSYYDETKSVLVKYSRLGEDFDEEPRTHLLRKGSTGGITVSNLYDHSISNDKVEFKLRVKNCTAKPNKKDKTLIDENAQCTNDRDIACIGFVIEK